MFGYEVNKIKLLLEKVIQQNVIPDVWIWLLDSNRSSLNKVKWNRAFAMVPRKTGRHPIINSEEMLYPIQSLRDGFTLNHWTLEKICRLYLLVGLDSSDRKQYISHIENLFLCGEVSELEALYAALPFLAYPTDWINRCTEGIRSNISLVLESIMYHNPFPADYLEEKAWNQMILKAIFTDKDLNKIKGLHERANRSLAYSLTDYANERCAAGRKINPGLWQLIVPYIDEHCLSGMIRILNSSALEEKLPILNALAITDFKPAFEVLYQYQTSSISKE